MHYITLTKLEYPTSISLRVKGLKKEETDKLSQKLLANNVIFTMMGTNYLEADLTGVEMLNLLAGNDFGFRVIGQAMAMELSSLGGRSFQIEKVIWTLEKSENN